MANHAEPGAGLNAEIQRDGGRKQLGATARISKGEEVRSCASASATFAVADATFAIFCGCAVCQDVAYGPKCSSGTV